LILYACFLWIPNDIGDVIVIVLASSAVYRGFEHGSGQTNVYKIGICCFSVKHETLRRKNRDWFTRFHNSTWVSPIFSLFSSIFSVSFHYSTYFSSILSISYYYSTCLSSMFSKSFHYSTYFLPYFPYHFTILLCLCM
jgi:hypothetical protein